MAERRQSFRFRMPWGSSGQQQPSAPKPPQAPPPPSTQASSPGATARSRTATPTESAQSRSSPEQSQSPSRGPKQSRAASSQPPPPASSSPEPARAAPILTQSPSRGPKQSPAASEQIPSPSRRAKESLAAPPPVKGSPEATRATPPPPSLPPKGSEPQLQPQSPPTTQNDPLPPPESIESQESINGKEESKPGGFKPEIRNETITSKPSPGAPTSPRPDKSDSSIVTAESRPEDRVKEKEIVQDHSEKEKINEVIREEPIQKKTVTELPTSESDETHPEKAEIQNGTQTHLQREIKDEVSNFVQKITTQPPKLNLEDNPNPVSVITLAGENKGASMQLGSGSSEQGDEIKIYRGYKATIPEDTTDDGERTYKERNPKTPSPEDPPAKAYININIQGSNNSIMYNSSITERDPGVQLFLTRKQGNKTEEKEMREGMEARKAEFRATPVQKMTYEPVVKRRCLGGLMMEPSDSDPDNPEKPRRHGCRFACKKENKDGENGV